MPLDMSWVRGEIRRFVRQFKRSRRKGKQRTPWTNIREKHHVGVEPLEPRILLSGSLGVAEWANAIGGEGSDVAYSVALDATNNSYVVGSFEGEFDIDPGAGDTTLTSNGGRDFYVAKYDADGNLLWGHGIGGADDDDGFGITVDGAGNVYVTGAFGESGGSGADFDPSGGVDFEAGQGGFVQKFDTDGNHQWVQTFTTANADNGVRFRDIGIDSFGNVVTVGDFTEVFESDFNPDAGVADLDFEGGIGDRNGFVAALDVDGNFLDAFSIGGSESTIMGLSYDLAGNLFVTGTGEGVDLDPTDADVLHTGAFIACYTPAGLLEWSRSFGDQDAVTPMAIQIDTFGSLWLTGALDSSGGQVDFDTADDEEFNLGSRAAQTDAFFARYDGSNGDLFGAFIVEGGTTEGNVGYDIAITPNNDVVFAGQLRTQQTINPDLDGGIGTTRLAGNGEEDGFILRLNPDGSFDEAFAVGGPQMDIAKSIAVDAQGNIYIAGVFNDEADFDPSDGELLREAASDEPDGFVAKLTMADPDEVNGIITGIKFEDTNQNGIQDFGEEALEGWTIFIDDNDNDILDDGEVSTVTDTDGRYTFADLAPGGYNIDEVQQAGFIPVSPPDGEVDVTVLAGVTTDQHFANFQDFVPGSVTGVKFFDHNRNRIQDVGDEGLQGWTIYLDANDNDTFDVGEFFAVTGADGSYVIEDVTPGTYQIREVPQDGWELRRPFLEEYRNPIREGITVVNADFGNYSELEVGFDQAGDLVNDNTPTIGGTIVDPLGGLDVDTADVTVSLFDVATGEILDGPFVATVNVGADVTWEHTFAAPLDEGTVGILVEVDLDSGTQSSIAGQLTVDTLGPTVVSTDPADASFTQVPGTFTVVFDDANDLDSDTVVDPANYILTFLGADETPGGVDDVEIADWIDTISYNTTTKTATITTDPTVILPADGVFTVTLKGTATITDEAGNALDGNADDTPGDDHVVTFTIDSTAPTGTVDASTTDNNSPTITGTVDDDTATVTINSIINQNTGEVFDNNGAGFTATVGAGVWTLDLAALATPLELPDGVYEVDVTFSDEAGNETNLAPDNGDAVEQVIHDAFDEAGDDDDTDATADPILTDGTPQTHSIHDVDDTDFTTFDVAVPAGFNVTVIPADGENVTVTLFGPDDPTAEVATQTADGQVRISQDLAAGQYWIQVSGDGTNVIPEYTIQVHPQPDLTIVITGDEFGQGPVLGNDGTINVDITNESGVDISGDIKVKIFLSEDGVLDGADQEIGEGTVTLTNLAAGETVSASVDVTLTSPQAIPAAGDFSFFASVDTDNDVDETNEANNDSAAFARTIGLAEAELGARELLVNPFGRGFLVRALAPNVAELVDEDGTSFRIVLAGPGAFQFVDDGNGNRNWVFDGTNTRTSVTITSLGGGNGVVDVDNIIVVGGSIGRITARTTDVAGDVLISDGTILDLTLRDIDVDHLIDIGGTVNDVVRITLRNAIDTTITSLSRILSLRADSITRSGGSPTDFTITAPALYQLIVSGDFENDLNINAGGALTGTVMQTIILGNLLNADWNVTGDMGRLMVRGQTDTFTLTLNSTLGTAMLGAVDNTDITISGLLGMLRADGFANGSVEAAAIRTLLVFGDAGFDLTLTGLNTLAVDLNVARVVNGTLTGDWSIAGAANVILGLGDADNFNLEIGGNVNLLRFNALNNVNMIVAGLINTMIFDGWTGGSLAANAVRTFISRADVDMDMLLTGQDAPANRTITVANVRGQIGSGDDGNRNDWRINGLVQTFLATNLNAVNIFDSLTNLQFGLIRLTGLMQDASIRTALGISTFFAAGMNNAELFAGMVNGFAGIAPDNTSFADRDAAIRNLFLTGRGLAGAAFINSFIAAWTLNAVTLNLVETDNGAVPFGVSSALIRRLIREEGGVRLIEVNLDESGDSITSGDFNTQIVDE